ncbi:hypothetical protein PILCRDRAFT_7114 [Piloderma croceum F 1598]|uniref:Secreted protein n=1 Tax=Piloderma croceum (strain F 1598) TaxID=765440 RepID=A0A0C3FH79_PILCF|nr:hypothetical protein PILCRDRAFT_7114 [Piloderma croceum F 1598]
MLSSIIFTTIFLTINYLYSTFASPVVLNGDVATGQSLKVTHSLAKRWYPDDQKCATPAQWVSRVCRPTIGDRAWEDRCTGPNGGVVIRYALSLCSDENTICSNIIYQFQQTILCVPRPVAQSQVPAPNQQTGVSQFGGIYNQNVEYIQSVTHQWDDLVS